MSSKNEGVPEFFRFYVPDTKTDAGDLKEKKKEASVLTTAWRGS